MAVQILSLKCPECNATLNIEGDRTYAFCTYCGTKILLNNENEKIYRHIDEAEIKQAETDRIIRLKQLEIAEKKRAEKKVEKKRSAIISLCLLGVAILMMLASKIQEDDSNPIFFLGGSILFFVAGVVFLSSKEDDDSGDDLAEKVIVPVSISGYNRQNYHAIEAMLKSAGFTNVRCVALNDLSGKSLFKKPGLVDSITINGKAITSGGKSFPKDAPVIITYHSLAYYSLKR